MSTMYPSVQSLALHLQNEQMCYMDDKEFKNITDEEEYKVAYEKVLKRTEKTTLTQFFELNKNEESKSRDILYPNILQRYTWNKAAKEYNERKRSMNGSNDERKSDTIGRIPVVAFTPKSQERYFLRLLLHHVKGPTSYENLKTVDGEVCETFKAACIKLGLWESDDEIEKSLEEAASIKFGSALRHCFVMLFVHAMPANPRELYSAQEQMNTA